MRRLLGTLAVSGLFAVNGAAWGCGDVADSHDDSFAQMTKPEPIATPVKKASETQVVAKRANGKQAARTPQQSAPVKVATRTTTD